MDNLFEDKIGFFRGFSESGLEFKADIVTPYHTEHHPIIGTFLLVAINQETALLGRITKFFPVGVMSSPEGDDYLAQMGRLKREVPEDLKESKLRYNVNVKLLGLIRKQGTDFKYSPSIRQLPHLGAWVGIPTSDVLKYICEIGVTGDTIPAIIGYLSFGDIVYDGVQSSPALPVKFALSHLIARRTYVFARAGYGKSNLMKLLITRLYENTQPGGTIIFDPEGEYAFRDKLGRYGLVDIPPLQDKIVVYTDRKVTPLQKRWVAGPVRLNLGHLRPSDVVNICVSSSKQEAVFANALRGMDYGNWLELLNEIDTHGYRTDDARITELVENEADTTPPAVKNNLVPIVRRLHSASSTLLEGIKHHLKNGRIVIIDVSLMSSGRGEELAGLILDHLFRHNQENFTEGSSDEVIPIISVIEEAQSVLSPKASDTSPFVVWAKEGRKYQLGSILVTQQPGAIAKQLLSQGDNFFTFHLLSENDLRELQKVNAHFSDDILSAILNEPIKGNAYLWSAPDQPFVLAAKISDFQKYAEELIQKAPKEAIKFTPAEQFSNELPDLQKRFDTFIQQAILQKKEIKVYENVSINGKPEKDVVATKFWNLKFGLTKIIGADLERLFCEKPFEDKDSVVKDDAIYESLTRLKWLHTDQEFKDAEKKTYLVLKKAPLSADHKEFDKTELKLQIS
jgi:hypothetical protein